jgi:hypothetical protein
MEMNGSEGLIIWHNKYIRVTLRNIKKGNRSQKEGERTQIAPAKSISRTTF